MANYREIVTKAVIGKGRKHFTTTNSITPEIVPTTIWLLATTPIIEPNIEEQLTPINDIKSNCKPSLSAKFRRK